MPMRDDDPAAGQFPLYYSFSQELTVRHQGKLTGSLSCINWLAMYLMQELAGASAELTGSYSPALAVAGLAPLVGLGAMFFLWGKAPLLPDVKDPEPDPPAEGGSTAIKAGEAT